MDYASSSASEQRQEQEQARGEATFRERRAMEGARQRNEGVSAYMKAAILRIQETKSPTFLLSLSTSSKQMGDKCYLAQTVPFRHSPDLTFPGHVHDLISL